MAPKFNVIAAACDNNGIGFKGGLPWKLKNEMAYFTRMTSDTKDKDKKNAVIMGRLTWNGIPKKYQPLKGRINVVISRTLTVPKHDELIFGSLNDALNSLSQHPYTNTIENFWIIGGASLYKEAMDSDMCHRIYLTKIYKSFECDKFFPEIPLGFVETIENEVPRDIQEENGVKYKFEVYAKNER